MRFSRVLAVAAFAFSGAALCQLPSAAQSVPVDFSGEVAPECESINVTPGVLVSANGAFTNELSSEAVGAPGGTDGQNAVIGRFSCNQSISVLFDSVTAPVSNPIDLQNLDCEVQAFSNSGIGGSSPMERCDTIGGGISFGGGTGQIVDTQGAEISLNVNYPAGNPMPVGTYDFTVNLSVVPQ